MKWLSVIATAATFIAAQANAAHERFHQDAKDPRIGFVVAADPSYVKECGTCHFAYSPGLLPARSWNLHMDRIEKHFGEVINLAPATRESLRKYLADNAADKSDYEGSQIYTRRLKAESTPFRLQEVPSFRQAHTTILETINVKPKITVRTLTNCGSCHQRAAEGSFANSELIVPGLGKRY